MKSFLRENFVIVLGATMPLLLMLALFAVRALQTPVAPPQYEAIYAHIPYYARYDFIVTNDGRLRVTWLPRKRNNDNDKQDDLIPENAEPLTLYRYTPGAPYAKAFSLPAPRGDASRAKTALSLPDELQALRLAPSPQSPDGYELSRHTRSSNNIFTDIFGYREDYNQLYLRHGTYYVAIPGATIPYGQEKFIGWVIKE